MLEDVRVFACAEKLESVLRSDRAIIHHLFKEGIITEDLYDEVLNPRSMLRDIDEAGQIVREIRRKVKTNSDYYDNLLSYFRENDEKYADIIKILDKEYSLSQSSSASRVPPSGKYRSSNNYYRI